METDKPTDPTLRERILNLHESIHGGAFKKSVTDLEILVEVLEEIVYKIGNLEEHSHRIS
jgi:hypothetical protein